MTEKIIKMLKDEVSINEMKKKLKIDNTQLINELEKIRNIGYSIRNEYRDNGIYYCLNKDICEITKPSNDIRYIIKNDLFKAIIISDTHIGSINDRIDYAETVVEYASINKIGNILHCGDFIEGVYDGNQSIRKFDTNKEMIDYSISKYPYDEKVKNFIILGNHDLIALEQESIDFQKIINAKRLDMVCLGYNLGTIRLEKDSLAMFHPNTVLPQKSYDSFIKSNYEIFELPSVAFVGHTHDNSIYNTEDFLVVRVPSLFDNRSGKIKGAWEVQIEFINEKMSQILLKSLSIQQKVEPTFEYVHKIRKNTL